MGIYLGRAYFNDLPEISFLYGVLLLGARIHLEFHSGGPGGGGGGGGFLKVELDRGKLQTLHPLFDLFDT